MVKRISTLLAIFLFVFAMPVYAQTVKQLTETGIQPEAAKYLAGGASKTPTTDATYDIGSTSYRWRDGNFSRNVKVGGTLGVTGAVGITGALNVTGSIGTSGALGASGALTVGGASTLTGLVSAPAGVQLSASIYEAQGATGSTAGNAQALTAGKFIHYITLSNGTKAVRLPACAAANIGEVHTLLNGVANSFIVACPDPGSTVNGGAADACYVTSNTIANKNVICFCQAAATWICG